MADDQFLNPVWHALSGPQADLARAQGMARTYQRDVTRFSAFGEPGPQAFDDLALLLGPGEEARLFRPDADEYRPADWNVALERPIIQMIADDPALGPTDPVGEPEGLVPLGRADGDEMLALARLTEPGPFEAGTVRIGGFIGVRREGRLIAMAGHRIKLPGHVEVSGICTHPDFRGRGLARSLTRLIMRGIRATGQTPILHAFPDNVGAIQLYRRLGFRVHRELMIRWLMTPN